ncbi:5-formyltetrahydrofolate cyclo-ligase [Nocardiopsis dassonvillei]|uniref:5-formyltetrahydrofolate cyclo-ligase n=1 Tax=Nocardiopsis dassonvillei TaxID=2014 RepID=UPI00034DC72F|nr:5-formyltetrahydrofolate cyclo-ligase [Nocardiopsis dassonvillei]MCK9872403.1 5-formyltetrahydrofolate cyclo-ligase [Nocardiopsis dassonvillei]
MTTNHTTEAKNHLRQKVWERLDTAHAGRTGPVLGKIPNFHGADRAAEHLAAHPRWQRARVVKANPDKAQTEVRLAAVQEGKLLYMAVPKIAGTDPFYLIDSHALTVPTHLAVTGAGAAEHAPRTRPERMQPVDVIVCGSVAVNHQGVRIGKGAGYSDIEMGLLAHAGLVHEDTLIVTTVHTLQVLDEPIPETGHDVSVDLIVTPDGVITCPPRRRPAGIVWEDLEEAKIAAIPILQELRTAAAAEGDPDQGGPTGLPG